MSVMIKSGSGSNLAAVDAAGNLAVAVNNSAPLPVSASTALPVTVGNASLPVTVGNASLPVTVGNASLAVTASAPLPVSASTALPVTVGNASLPVTVGNASLPVTVGNASLAVTASAPLPVSASTALPVLVTDNARASVVLSGTNLAVGTSGVETALTLQLSRGLTITNGTSFVTPAGKSLRIQALVLTAVGSATATAYQMTVRMRYNAGGAVTTTSTPVLLPVRLASPSSAFGYCQAVVPIPDEWWLPVGDGTAQYGFTVNATYTTNAPTVDVQLIGFEL